MDEVRTDTAQAFGAPPHRVWWTLLNQRIDQVRALLPRRLQGVVQFEVARIGGAVDFFYLELRGTRTKEHDGIADDHDVWVNTTEDELAELLESDKGVEGALRASGKVELLTGLLDAVAGAQPAARSFIELRARK